MGRISARSADHSTTRSISARDIARRIVLGVGLKLHRSQRQLLHRPLPSAPNHPAQHYTMTANAFFRGSLGPNGSEKSIQ